MEVTQILTRWPEDQQRERRWFSLSQAAMAVHEPDLSMLLLRLET